MNVLKKVWCRLFQTGLRIALPVLPYRNPIILKSITNDIPAVLLQKNIHSVLLVTDHQVRALGLTAPLENALQKSGITCTVYDKTVANPTTKNVTEAAEQFKIHCCGAFIAFGGGSAMDCAKGAGAAVANPKKQLSQMAGILKVRRRIPLLLAVPTTAGTGSETTLAAVITDDKTRHKYPINDFPLIPSYAVLDPAVTASLPYSVAATTGMDALTHAVEAYIGRSTTKETRRDAVRAVQMIFQNISEACNGQNEKAHRNMLEAAHYAGRAFTRSYVGYVHALAHALGGKYNAPHGLANAVLLVPVLEMYGKAAQKKLARLAKAADLVADNTSDAEAASAFIEKIRTLSQHLHIPQTLPCIKEEDIPALARTAEHEGNPLYPVPVLWDAAQLEKALYRVSDARSSDTIKQAA